MTTIIDTNAPERFTRNGVVAGYHLPDADPLTIRTKFVPAWDRRNNTNTDEMIYVVTWAGDVWATMFTIGNDWNDIYFRTINADRAERLRRLDAALAEVAKPLASLPANIIHEAA
jgi:hypothetical protein